VQRADEDVAGEEGFEVYEREGVWGGVEDLGGIFRIVEGKGGCWAYLRRYVEGAEFDSWDHVLGWWVWISVRGDRGSFAWGGFRC
jgi:hypothetical protein